MSIFVTKANGKNHGKGNSTNTPDEKTHVAVEHGRFLFKKKAEAKVARLYQEAMHGFQVYKENASKLSEVHTVPVSGNCCSGKEMAQEVLRDSKLNKYSDFPLDIAELTKKYNIKCPYGPNPETHSGSFYITGKNESEIWVNSGFSDETRKLITVFNFGLVLRSRKDHPGVEVSEVFTNEQANNLSALTDCFGYCFAVNLLMPHFVRYRILRDLSEEHDIPVGVLARSLGSL